MAIDSFSLSEVHEQLAIANLDRLARHKPPSRPDNSLIDNKELCNITLRILEGWSSDNTASINTSIASQVFIGQSNISWPIAFLPFMESMGMYLRDYSLLDEAWQEYRAYKANGSNDEITLKHCVKTYHAAYDPIRKLAQFWGLEFVPLCDLLHTPPDGQPHWDGPYCGAFYTTNAQKNSPFVGIAFKGTNPANLRDVKVDYNYQLTSVGQYLGGAPTRVSLGVFTALFSRFEEIEDIAYDYIVASLTKCVSTIPGRSDTNIVKAHVTGHSLGGSYSSLFYAQFFQDGGKIPVNIGDEYTFGAPRVGNEEWATYNNTNFSPPSNSQSWRVVNDQDLVPQIPATSLRPTELDFYHIDKGMKIFNDNVPQPIPTEIGLPPPPPVQFDSLAALIKAIKDSTFHLPKSYYDSMVCAINNTK
ncbi:Feruloyl esterase A [Colletotrichum fructicola Nara gc5]|uniref:Feruloyl esterase A n=1 Tax=Colletotrichum fructicola (strain Nara gc5) TaxID=1213859 RepID=L2GAQ4_COLFN|nr:Feruloyl esterase A [Colletotrichum fructicola]KAF4477853.1 Feruloyl esterase A [Colletotrichum fructicola Nara gc5]KAF4888594.1 Feruloyl esterase A [Colletotrichum fructicola]